MKTSQSIIKIAPALLAAQKKIGAATKGSVNPFFHSTYASLGDVMEACKEILNDNGITILQPIETDENGVEVQTILLHESGEWIGAGLKIAPKSESNPQDQGSAISYARRYSLQSMVFIPSADDDAEKAVNRPVHSPVSTPVHKPTQVDEIPTPDEEGYTREPIVQPEDSRVCNAHDVPVAMQKKHSASKNKDYWAHWHNNGQVCFGQGYQE